MSKGNTFETDVLQLIFNATAIGNIADNTSSVPLTSLYVGLHETWPGESSDQETGEVNYDDYARVAVARTSLGFTVSGNSVSPAGAVAFPPCGATYGGDAYFISIGTDATGPGKILYKGAIGPAPTLLTGAVTDTITSPGHGLVVDDPVVFWPVLGLSLPTGITEGTVYYVLTVPDVDTLTISTAVGGATLNITASGVGAVQKITPVEIFTGATPTLTTATTISED